MKSRILIVDDSKDIRALLKRMLPASRFDLSEAATGEEALAKMDIFNPDLILLDIIMPGIDGYQVCSSLREKYDDIPVIFLSGRSDTADKVRGLECGGNDYITKPFDKAEVLARIDSHLKIRKLTCELKQANAVLQDKQRVLDADLQAAAGIQQSLLPQKIPEIDNLMFGWRFMPSYTIGGDIFNIIRLDESHVGIYMIDVSGHGAPAALITVSVSQALKPDANGLTKERIHGPPGYRITPPRELMESLDREYPIERFDRYFTIVYLIIDTATGRLAYSNAAHPMPILMHKNGKIETLEKGGTIIGIGGRVPFDEGEALLQPGDRIVLFTDGIPDCQNERGDFYGTERFTSVLRSGKRKTIPGLLEHMVLSITQFTGDRPFQDDISIVVIEYSKPGTRQTQRANRVTGGRVHAN